LRGSWLSASVTPFLRGLGRYVEVVHLVENIAKALGAFADKPPAQSLGRLGCRTRRFGF
jgi:hypothetical protein